MSVHVSMLSKRDCCLDEVMYSSYFNHVLPAQSIDVNVKSQEMFPSE
uniref:Uncharacterized protein n=1 Tax=Arundo donax TaxID=35708 RepID=A0A0A9EUN8_ARUDO